MGTATDLRQWFQRWFGCSRGLSRGSLGLVALLLSWLCVRYWMPAPRLTGNDTLDQLYRTAAANLLLTWAFLWPLVWGVAIAGEWLKLKVLPRPDDATVGFLLRRPVNWLAACLLAAGATALMYFGLTLPDYRSATSTRYDNMREAQLFAARHGLSLERVANEINTAIKDGGKKDVELGGQAQVFVAKYLTISPDQKLRHDDWRLLENYLNAQADQGQGGAGSQPYLSSCDALRDKVLIPLIEEWIKGHGLPGDHLKALIGDRLRNWLAPIRPFGEQAESPQKLLQTILNDVASRNPGASILIPKESAAALAMAETILLRHKEELAPYHRAVEMLASSYIQPATIWLFFIALVLLHARECIPLLNSWRAGEKYSGLLINRMHKSAKNPADQLSEAENVLERVEYRSLEYLIWAMPSLGFIGTVVGVGAALGNADKVVSAISKTEQRDAIAAVTAVLGVAFDTTLVALVCLVPTLLLASARRRIESRMLLEALNDTGDQAKQQAAQGARVPEQPGARP